MTSTPTDPQPSSEAAKPDRWEVIYVIPNLSPAKDRWSLNGERRPSDLLKTGMTLGSNNLAIVPVHDPRVQAALAHDSIVARLLGVFVDERGKKLLPAVLIAREVPTPTLTQEAIVAFRNSIALSVILRNRAWWAKGNDNGHMGWSDYFDFHPLRAGTHGLVSDSPALTSIITERAKHQAMPSPYVSATTMTALWADGFLYWTLGAEWRRFFEARDKAIYGEGLFRSLEIAYVASATPVKHGGSIYEWGVQVALWVSAIEVLVSVLNGEANQLLSLDLLAEYEWGDYRPDLQAKNREVTFGRGASKTVRQLNIVQHACHLLYRTRHKFLHGNKVDNADMYPWGQQLGLNGEPRISIVALAPVIYRIALHAFLSRHHKPNFNDSAGSTDIDPLLLASVLAENDYADALKAAYKIPDKSETEVEESDVELGDVEGIEGPEVGEGR